MRDTSEGHHVMQERTFFDAVENRNSVQIAFMREKYLVDKSVKYERSQASV